MTQTRQYFESVPVTTEEALVELQGDLAIELQEALEEKRWTQRQLATCSGVNEVNLSRIINGSANTTLRTIAALQCALQRRLLRFSWVEKRIVSFESEHEGWQSNRTGNIINGNVSISRKAA